MATDYILFVHGVKNRSQAQFELQAQKLFEGIRHAVGDSPRQLRPIFLFWGDLNVAPQKALLEGLKASSQWSNIWFQNFRSQEILEFVGDAALYLSRHIGSAVVRRFQETALKALQNREVGDRLHLVTHSLGTVILFDILFAGRWEDPRLDSSESTKGIRQMVSDIRYALFGVGDHPQEGIPIASIHTLGSPIALFSLLSINGESSHDLTSNLEDFLMSLYQLRQQTKLPWRNFIHPGDPIAYPLEGVIPTLIGKARTFVDLKDVVSDYGNIWNLPFQQSLVPLLWGGDAHGSYWKSKFVIDNIGDIVRQS